MVIISQATLNEIKAAALAAYPLECCGLLSGVRSSTDTWRVMQAHPTRNVAVDPQRWFEVDPSTHLRLQRELRDAGQAVIGHYHSHPDGVPAPSAADLAAAQDPGLMWLIVAVSGGQAAVSAYCFKGAGFAKLDLSILS
jgi:proteasome lid subunit RPN8/RPN11